MCGESRATYPADEDDAQAERARLHAQLQSHGDTHGEDRPVEASVGREAEKSRAETAVTLPVQKYAPPGCDGEYAGDESRHTGAEKTPFGKAGISVDKKGIAYDVQQVAGKQYEHGGERVGRPVGKMLECVEEQYRNQPHEMKQVVGAHQRQQFRRETQAVEKEV